MDDIIKIAKSLKDSGLSIDGATEKIKYEKKQKLCGLLSVMMAPIFASLIAPIVYSLIEPVTFYLINATSEKRIIRAGKGSKLVFSHY